MLIKRESIGRAACYLCIRSCQARVRLLDCFWLVLCFLVLAGLASATSFWSSGLPYEVVSSTVVCRSDNGPYTVHFVVS